MSSEPVLYASQFGIATLTLNQGQRMSPLDDAVLDGLLAGIVRVHEDKSVRALILTGTGKGFSAGADLADYARRLEKPDADQSLGQHVERLLAEKANKVVLGLRNLPVPVVSAVNGVAAGGGVGLALAADIVIAARSAYFYLPFIPSLGAIPDMGATWSLARSIGRQKALGLSLLGSKLPAEAAEQWGLIWACVDDDQLGPASVEIAERLAALPATAISEARQIFASAERNGLQEQLQLEATRQGELVDSPNFAEGVAAFRERRKPVFPGRG